MDDILLIGGGGHAAAVLEVLREQRAFRPVGVVDPAAEPGSELLGLPVLGGDDVLADWASRVPHAFLGVGSVRGGRRRRTLYETAVGHGFTFPTLVHGSAIVAPDVVLGAGTVVMPGAVVRTGSRLGCNVIVNTAATVDHHGRIGSHAHVATAAVLAGEVSVGENGLVGAGAVVLQGRHVGDGATVGAGAVVTRDVPAGVTVVGAPARPVSAR